MERERFVNETGADFITSRANPRVVLYAGLDDRKKRNEAGLFLAEGIKLTRDALAADYPAREILLSETALGKSPDAAETAMATEKAPQGIIAVLRLPEPPLPDGFSAWAEEKRLLMLCEIQDPGNLGTILRSAEALGVGGVVLAGCADPYQPKAVRAAMGTLFRLPLWTAENGADCVGALRAAGRRVLAAALGENDLTLGDYEPLPGDCPVIGNEGHGLPAEVLEAADFCLRIPMAPGAESLNASAAAACILWEYYRGRRML